MVHSSTALRPVASVVLCLAFLGFAGLASGGCGGGRSDYLGDGGTSSGSGGGSSGGSSGSSSGVSGSSSGISGSSSGISGSSSGISGSSSGGAVCNPLPGCTSTSVCPAGDGCNTCYCAFDGSWQCTSQACVIEAGTCPQFPPSGACPFDGESCGYANGACGEQCDCQNGQWQCFSDPCPPPVCPPAPPQSGTGCGPDGLACGYPTGTCGGEQCDCSGGLWQCSSGGCPPPPQCPMTEPPNGLACNSVGTLCDYPTNNGVCQYDQCECDQSGTWGCTMGACFVDAGFGD